MREVTREWVSKAEGDYRSAERFFTKLKSLRLTLPVFIPSSVLKNT